MKIPKLNITIEFSFILAFIGLLCLYLNNYWPSIGSLLSGLFIGTGLGYDLKDELHRLGIKHD